MIITLQIHLLQTQPLWLSLITFLGLIFIIKPIINLLNFTYKTFLRPSKNLKTCYGSYALITGSSDGIGKAIALELASRGLNLILFSKSLIKLTKLSNEIGHKFPNIKIKIIALDFSKEMSISCISDEIKKGIHGLDVGVLVNNVGITYPKGRYFHEVNEGILMEILRVNLGAINGVTKAVLPVMLKKGKGVIVNIGSGASVVVPSHPLFAIYAATKAYIDQFSRSIYVEYKNLGIDVQCQVPLYVATKMASSVASIERSTMFIPTAKEYATAAVRRFGYEARCTPFWAHSLQWYFASFLPSRVLDAWRLSIGIRRRYAN
ncbi:unnamed protein product [Amaranthus hypochondriacus]